MPQALAPAIKAIRGLYTIEEDPQSQSRVMQMDSPSINLSSTEHVMGPGDFDVIYDVPNYPSSGTGEKIGIVARSRTYAADFTFFQAATGVTFSYPTEVVPTAFGGVDPGPAYTSPPGSGVSTGDQLKQRWTLNAQEAWRRERNCFWWWQARPAAASRWTRSISCRRCRHQYK